MTTDNNEKNTQANKDEPDVLKASMQTNMQIWQESMNFFNKFASNIQDNMQNNVNNSSKSDNNKQPFSPFTSPFTEPFTQGFMKDYQANKDNQANEQPNNNLTDNLSGLTQRFINETMRMSSQSGGTGKSVMMDVMEGWQQVSNGMTEKNPTAMLEQQMNLWQEQMQLYQNTMLKMAGNKTEPVIEVKKGDKRFKDDDWENNPVFDFLKQSYLLTTKNMMETIENSDGIDEKTRQRLSFFTRQWLNAAAPSNFVWSNPEVLRMTMESGGQNLMQGLKQLTDDMEQSSDVLSVRMTDQSAFRLGENIATTDGKVVFRNRMIELIQYTPTTDKVSKRPLLIVPPWINKFYIMDLTEKNSYIRWVLGEGHSVFIISWVNPTPDYKHVGMDTYMHEGLLTALDVVKAITGEPDANVIGYCIGGLLLSLTLSWLEENNQADCIASATFWTTMFDFSDPGDIGVFLEEKMVSAVEVQEEKQGVFDGRLMSVAFSLLRENSLYWNYYIQNYLKGERPTAFDLLYWNSDCTNVTADLHRFILRELYLGNKMIKKGELEFDGIKIDLSKVKTPVYVVSALHDHIARWKGCYEATQVLGGDVTFVLGESGHIAGVMNPPTGKYGYYADKPKRGKAKTKFPEDSNEWFKNSEKYDESWWLHWSKWVNKHRGDEVDARQPGKDHEGKDWQVICDAPGTYVHIKADEALKAV